MWLMFGAQLLLPRITLCCTALLIREADCEPMQHRPPAS